MKIKLHQGTIGIALLVGCVSPVWPQDQHVFDGFYAGAEGGYNRFELNANITDVGEIDDNSIYYGGFLGWRNQFQSGFVFGSEVRFGDSSAKSVSQVDILGETATVAVKGGRQIGVDFIFGRALGPRDNILIFGSGGYVNGKASATATLPGLALTVEDSDTDHGFRAGGGVEFRLTDMFNGRIAGYFEDIDNLDQYKALASIVIPFN